MLKLLMQSAIIAFYRGGIAMQKRKKIIFTQKLPQKLYSSDIELHAPGLEENSFNFLNTMKLVTISCFIFQAQADPLSCLYTHFEVTACKGWKPSKRLLPQNVHFNSIYVRGGQQEEEQYSSSIYRASFMSVRPKEERQKPPT